MAARDVLAESGWSTWQWATATNRILNRQGHPAVSTRAPWRWLGPCGPRDAAVRVAATSALAAQVQRPLTATDLWPGASDTTELTDAVSVVLDHPTARLLHPLTEPQTWPLLDEWGLTSAALDAVRPGLGQELATNGPSPRHQIAVISTFTEHLRRLDDRRGGGELTTSLVSQQLRVPLELLRNSDLSYTTAERQALLSSAAQLAQLHGWLMFDAGNVAGAQQSLLRGMKAATEAGATDDAINMLGMLAYIAAHTDTPKSAVFLAEHANTMARSRPALVRARAAGRLATAYAATGDELRHRRAAEHSRELMARNPDRNAPSHLYYFSQPQLAAETGQALHVLARSVPTRRQRQLHAEAATSLAPLAQSNADVAHQRSALLHGAYLALAHLARDELEPATHAVTLAAARLAEVDSGRCRSLLEEVRRKLVKRTGNEWAATAIRELDQAGLRL